MIVVALPYLSRYDAVSNDARMQVGVLREAGAQAVLYAELFEPGCEQEAISHAEFATFSRDPGVVLIYHMCVAWDRLDQLLPELRCRILLRYHNITPPRFFDAYDREASYATRAGLAQMARLLAHPRVGHVMVTSPFTLDEMTQQWGAFRATTSIVAPFLSLPDADKHTDDAALAGSFQDGKTHLLFVGRWVPNKAHHHLVAVVSSYRELYDDEITLTVAGKVSPNFAAYQNNILALAKALNLTSNIRLLPTLSERELMTAYRHASAFLVASEHEGFCVPIVEAQSLSLPVIGWEQTAVGTTIGKGQLSSAALDYDFFAAAAAKVAKDSSLKALVTAAGHANAALYKKAALATAFIAAVESFVSEVSPNHV